MNDPISDVVDKAIAFIESTTGSALTEQQAKAELAYAVERLRLDES